MEYVNTFPLSARNIEKIQASNAESLMIVLIATLFNNKQRFGLNEAVYKVSYDKVPVSEENDMRNLAKMLGYKIKFEAVNEVKDSYIPSKYIRITLSLPEVNTFKIVAEE